MLVLRPCGDTWRARNWGAALVVALLRFRHRVSYNLIIG